LYTGYTAIACDDRRPAELTESTGIIKSPGYDKNTYQNSALCQWLIRAPAGKVRMICYYFIAT